MSFTWPTALFSLLLVPLLAAGYAWIVRRRDAAAAEQLGALRLTEAASGRRVGWRRHLPPALFLLAIALLLAALARPTVVLALPHREGTVILAFDVSSSMLADDLKPSRMEAAKQAASEFVRKQPSTVRIGVVAFSDTALVMQQPTNVQGDVLAAIARIEPQGGTSLAAGMIASLDAIAGRQVPVGPTTSPTEQAARSIGYFGNAVVVLLTDGEDTTRADPATTAQLLDNAGVRVFPIGIGSANGATIQIEGYTIATMLNEPLLEQIAATTGGKYYRAADEAKLSDVYKQIDLQLTVRGQRTEVTALAAAAAMVLMMAGAGFTMRWFGRVP